MKDQGFVVTSGQEARPAPEGDVAATPSGDLFGAPTRRPFSEWMAALNALAACDGMETPLQAQTGVCCWMAFYDDGYSPAAAWAEECSNG